MNKLGFTKALGVLAAMALSGFAMAAIASPGASPAKLCKTERADANFAAGHGGKTFAQYYGANKNQKNAFGKCVAAKAKAKASSTTTTQTTTTQATTTTSQSEATAAAACKAERADANFAAGHGGKTFAQHYGTNGGQQNAFGKCVSTKAKAKSSS